MAIERCEECGFDPSDVAPDAESVADAVRAFARRYRMPLTRGLAGEDLDAVVRVRPSPDVWSALEYAAHARDIFRVFDDRVRGAVEGRQPAERVVDWEGRVAAASPSLDREAVAADVADAADTLAATFTGVESEHWRLPAVTGRGREETLLDLAAIVVHEGGHHLLDIGRSLRAARGR